MSNWFKSSYSANVGQCVEVKFDTHNGYAHVRHSKADHHLEIVYTREEWLAFIAGVKNGEFNWPEKEFCKHDNPDGTSDLYMVEGVECEKCKWLAAQKDFIPVGYTDDGATVYWAPESE